MRKPEQTTEPSIEEILASIRRIIADEGGPMAPVFDQAGPGAVPPQRHQPQYDEYQDNGGHFEETRTRQPHADDRDPRHREQRYEERQFDEARYEEPRYQEPHHAAAPQRGPQPRGYMPEPQPHDYREHQRRAEFRGDDGHDDYQNGYDSRAHADARHVDYHERDGAAGEFDRGHDFRGHEFGGAADFDSNGFKHDDDARHDYDTDGHAATNFDPYATEDDFGAAKPVRAATGNDDEILELTEDFMVEETGADADTDAASASAASNGGYDGDNYRFQAGEDDTASDYAPFRDFNDPKFDFTEPGFSPVDAGGDGEDKLDEYVAHEDEPAAPAITATMAPVTDETFAGEGLDSVLSNVVAEMQRLSEGKGLAALLESPAPEAERASPPEGVPAFADEPQQRPGNWQPKARQTSAPAQRPVWSARRLDGDGGGAQQRASSPQTPQGQERSASVPASAMGAPFAEAMEPKTPSHGAPVQPHSAATPTALARNANLRVEVEEIMPDLPEGDFPPETSSDEGRARSKPAVDALSAIRARAVETVPAEETPELPSEEDDESVVQPGAAVPQAVKQPQARAPEVPVAAVAAAPAKVAPSKAAPVPSQDNTPEACASPAPLKAPMPAERGKHTPPQAPAAAKAVAEKIAAAALPDGLEDGVREMLKPLIAEWLKENLPRITEEVLRHEMQNSHSPERNVKSGNRFSEKPGVKPRG